MSKGCYQAYNPKINLAQARNAAKWNMKHDKREKLRDNAIISHWKKTGLMNKDGTFNPYAIRALSGNCAGKMSAKHTAILAGVLLVFAAVGGVAYYEMTHGHHDGGIIDHDPPSGNEPPSMHDLNTILTEDHNVTVCANATDGDGSISAYQISVLNSNGSEVYSEKVNGESLQKKINLNSQPEGTYKVKVLAVDNKGSKSVALEKMVDLPSLGPNQPPVIVGKPWIQLKDINDCTIVVNATDDKMVSYVHVRIYFTLDNGTVYEASKEVSAKSGTVSVHNLYPKGYDYGVEVYAVDKGGLVSQHKFAKFNTKN